MISPVKKGIIYTNHSFYVAVQETVKTQFREYRIQPIRDLVDLVNYLRSNCLNGYTIYNHISTFIDLSLIDCGKKSILVFTIGINPKLKSCRYTFIRNLKLTDEYHSSLGVYRKNRPLYNYLYSKLEECISYRKCIFTEYHSDNLFTELYLAETNSLEAYTIFNRLTYRLPTASSVVFSDYIYYNSPKNKNDIRELVTPTLVQDSKFLMRPEINEKYLPKWIL